jgi:hypothetical protein
MILEQAVLKGGAAASIAAAADVARPRGAATGARGAVVTAIEDAR